ncbi:GNAT family N-acetyltransferase [Gammaproteobacteria bacterium 45_16_T64]|nr:GNAT family N-acetyltransferase [Gammaproteobacteria bacterium 45_16_T64]
MTQLECQIRQIPALATYKLRQAVLWPNKPIEHCIIDGDEQALHLGAYLEQELVCVASIFIDDDSARLRKFATLPDYQNKGIGSRVIKHVLNHLSENSINHFWCDAREDAIAFYEHIGMIAKGERFFKHDVAYYKMEINITSQ